MVRLSFGWMSERYRFDGFVVQPFTFRKLVVRSLLSRWTVFFIVFIQFDLDLMSGTCFIVM